MHTIVKYQLLLSVKNVKMLVVRQQQLTIN